MEETVQVAEESVNLLEKFGLNWLVLAVLAIFVIGVIIGAVKGAFKMIFAVIAIVLAIALTILISPVTKSLFMRNANIYNFFYQKTEALAEKNGWIGMLARMAPEASEDDVETGGADSIKILSDLLDLIGVPEKYKQSILGDESVIATMETNSDATTNETLEKIEIGAYTGITNVVIKALAFLTTLLIVGVVLALLSGLFSLLGKIPGIDKANAIAGGIAGGFIALMVIWVIFAIITMLGNTAFGQNMLAMIGENKILSFIYNHNFISSRILS
ncbi:MAG: CvpA family protein [Lachnospiraceae bacterium]|nr:CvpA family protein [Lachnospiraceae bacterium]